MIRGIGWIRCVYVNGQTGQFWVDELVWSDEDWQQGKLIKIRGFPKEKKVKQLRVTKARIQRNHIACALLV